MMSKFLMTGGSPVPEYLMDAKIQVHAGLAKIITNFINVEMMIIENFNDKG